MSSCRVISHSDKKVEVVKVPLVRTISVEKGLYSARDVTTECEAGQCS